MEKPEDFAAVLLAEGKGWSADQVKEQWDNGVNSAVTLDRPIPVHMTYFTVVVDENGRVSTFADLYGLRPQGGERAVWQHQRLSAAASRHERPARRGGQHLAVKHQPAGHKS